ncbi:ABC transporter, ATP-binding protein [Streptococcus pseudoporcinus]|uniref:ABC transporter, ATP-binding protein n=1 Tax=Streptococcus pseudoporcinus TaxID=361101 RepID=A0A4U9YJL5_9STRE|nr:ABC transporter ATP-binding protein [Streptococcus pseudoporcinus]VTS26953.1 ABC transporter, ATP-binding protein [Streptococcus pseudoporcinus]
MTKEVMLVQDLGFTYEGNQRSTLNNINVNLDLGQIVFLTGRSGSGKSTLLNIINGIIPEVIEGQLIGDLWIDGQNHLKVHERNLLLGNVFQNLRSQFFTTNTTSELVFEMENCGVSHQDMVRRLKAINNKFKIEDLLDRHVMTLSSGERQFLALLTALMINPNILIFDEPSANLDYGNVMRLREQIGALKKEKKLIIIADHRCFYLQGMMDRVLLLEDRTLKNYLSEEDFYQTYYGKRDFDLFSHVYPPREISQTMIETVKINQVSYKQILKDITLSFYRYEVAMIIGNNGAGKTSLAKLIARLLKPCKGSVEVESQPLYIMQEAEFQLFCSSCLKELEITCHDNEKNKKALQLVDLYDLKDKHPHSLSGGEKQRLQLAIAFVSSTDVIILDEPTSGLDKASMEKIIAMLQLLKKEKTIIIISHDYEFIRGIADRIIYIAKHQIADDFYLEAQHIRRLNTIYNEMEQFYDKTIED